MLNAVLLGAALGVVACSADQSPGGQAYLADARVALEAKKLAEARVLAELAAEADTPSPEAAALMAQIHRAGAARSLDRGELRRAFDEFVAASEVEPSPAPRSADLQAALTTGRDAGVDLETLAGLAGRAVEATPSSPEARQAAAELYDQIGELEAAVVHYMWVWEADPTKAAVGMRLGQLLLTTGRPADARDVTDRVLAVDPDNVQARLQLAEALEALGEHAAARRTYVELGEAHPDNAAVSFRFADFLERRGEADEAEALRARARDQMPGVDRRQMRRLR